MVHFLFSDQDCRVLIYRIAMKRAAGKSGQVNTFEKGKARPLPYHVQKTRRRAVPSFDGNSFALEQLQSLQMYGFEFAKATSQDQGVGLLALAFCVAFGFGFCCLC